MLRDLKCVLIAEDNGDDFFQISRSLDQIGLPGKRVRVHTITELFSYFHRAASQSDPECPAPDVLLLDPNLADGNVLGRLKELQLASPEKFLTVILSGRSDVTNIREAYQAGADTFLSKPLRPVELLNFLTFKGFEVENPAA